MLTSEKINEFYDKLQSTFGLQNEALPVLQEFLTQQWTAEDRALLAAREGAAMLAGHVTLMYAITQRVQDDNSVLSPNAKLLMDGFRFLLNHLPDELLHREFSENVRIIVGHKNTSLSFAIAILIKIYECNLKEEFTNYRAYQTLTNDWFNQIVQPLLDKGIDVDQGNHHRRYSNLAFCLMHAIDIEGDVMMKLVHLLLEKTKMINGQNAMDKTSAIFILLRRQYALKYFKLFAEKGASFNVRAYRQLFETFTETPFLTQCIQSKNFQVLQLALEAGADPNLPAYREGGCTTQKDKEPLLTPYQFAVAFEIEEAIAIFVAWSQKTNITLVATLPSQHKNSVDSLDQLRIPMRTDRLELACRNRMFRSEQHLIQTLVERFGVRCYLSDLTDRQNVEEAMTWLYDVAPNTALRRIWDPILAGLKMKFANNPTFAIYICEIPKQAVNSNCLGLYKDDLYAVSGATAAQYIEVIAHEAAHMFDHEQTTLACGRGQFQLAGSAFSTRFFRDVERDRKGAMEISPIVDKIRSVYRSSSDPSNEYFAYLFISEVFMRVIANPQLSEEEVLQGMRSRLPESFAWYEQTYGDPQAAACPSAVSSGMQN